MIKASLAFSGAAFAIAAAAVFVLNGTSVAGMNYECWTYVNGHPDKMINIVAVSKSDAESQAPARFKDLGARWDYIQCN